MGIISFYSYYFTKKFENDINQKEESYQKEDLTKSPKSLKSLELKNDVKLGENDIIYEIKQFSSGSIIITTQNGKIIYFDKTLKYKKEIKKIMIKK